tara:strand:- start:613 stop:729 length:117 start_codon:yes stop_codon:yes gene_type:complete
MTIEKMRKNVMLLNVEQLKKELPRVASSKPKNHLAGML